MPADELAAPAGSTEKFLVYSHIGPKSRRISAHESEGSMRIRPDLRHRDGLLAAPLGIGVLDCLSKNTRTLAPSAPIRIDVNVLDPATDVQEVSIQGRILHHGRTLIVSDATISDRSDPPRTVAYATVTWSVTGPPVQSATGAEDPTLTGESPAAPDTSRPLWEVFGGIPRPDGGFDIPALTPSIGHGRLHGGVMQTLAEAASMSVAGRATGCARLRTEHLGTNLIGSGRAGPFSITPRLLSSAAGSASCQVGVVDHGAGDRLVASLFVRLGLVS